MFFIHLFFKAFIFTFFVLFAAHALPDESSRALLLPLTLCKLTLNG